MKHDSIGDNGLSARDQVLDVAERHFAERGFSAVTLKDIAQELGIRQPSLYYHAPGGKEELFVAVMLRHLERHWAGVEATIAQGETDDLEAKLRRVAVWMLSRPPLNLRRMARADMPKLSPESRTTLEAAVRRCVRDPVRTIFAEAAQAGKLRQNDLDLVSWFFLSQVEALHARERFTERPATELVDTMIDLLLHGIARSESELAAELGA